MRKWILTALAAGLLGLVAAPGTAPADEAGQAAARTVERTTVTRVRRHRVRVHRRVHRRRVLVYGRGPHLGRYFYCPPPENVCQLTPRLVWTPAGYQRVFYPRLVW